MRIATKQMTYEDWIKERMKGVGGSDAAAILGMNKWSTPLQVYMEKIGEIEHPPAGEAAYWGTKLEDVVAKEFEKRTGKKIRNVNAILIHPEHDFLIANIDRKIVGENAILECKTTSAYNKDKWEGDEIPQEYIIQVMHYLNVTGYDKAYFAVLIGGQRFMWKEIERDEELIELIQKKEIEFWVGNVLKQIPPEPTEYDGEVIDAMYQETIEDAIDLDADTDQIIDKLNELKADIKSLDDIKKEYENKLKIALKEHETGLTPKYQVTWKPYKRTYFDSKKFKSEKPDLYESYSEIRESRTLRIKEVK